MKQTQVLSILKDRIDLEGASKDIFAKLSAQNVKIIRVKAFPEPRYIDNKDGTVFDTWHNIYIVKLPHTDLPNHFKEAMPWEEFKIACAELSFAGHKGWSLPSPVQGFSLVKNNPTGPQIDMSIFKDTKEAGYWTNEEVAWIRSLVRIVHYGGGGVGYGSKGDVYYVRPVRASQ
ncbi:MAG: DUF1566 domain-containing protein [Candidatus Omnitrophota bacterium]